MGIGIQCNHGRDGANNVHTVSKQTEKISKITAQNSNDKELKAVLPEKKK